MKPPFLVTKSHKSVGIAILLTFLFGSVGLLYASVLGGLLMTFTPIILAIILFFGFIKNDFLIMGWSFGLLIFAGLTFWLINIIWAAISVKNYNRKIDEEAKRQFEIWNNLNHTDKNQPTIKINQNQIEGKFSSEKIQEISNKPNIQDWLKNNPSMTINDYYSKFR